MVLIREATKLFSYFSEGSKNEIIVEKAKSFTQSRKVAKGAQRKAKITLHILCISVPTRRDALLIFLFGSGSLASGLGRIDNLDLLNRRGENYSNECAGRDRTPRASNGKT
jgi:hypothetical protein